MEKLLIETQKGLGDNIYARPFIKAKAEHYDLYLKTPFPQIYSDLNVKFVKAFTTLRTQTKNIGRTSVDYVQNPRCPILFPHYTAEQVRYVNMFKALGAVFGCKAKSFDLPKFSHKLDIPKDKPLCIVRPVTVRKEWVAMSRNPDPKYIHEASALALKDYHVISIADIDVVNEYALNPMPMAHEHYNSGQLPIEAVLALIQQADLVIGGVGFIVPTCIATKTNLFCVLGGNGGLNAPQKITDESMDLSKVHFSIPDYFCMCPMAKHMCNKTISNFKTEFKGYLDDIRSSTTKRSSMV